MKDQRTTSEIVRVGCEQFDANCIILFGSRAASCNTIESDYDVLCVGRVEARKRLRLGDVWLDVVAITTEKALGKPWLGSELASHVAAYGVCLYGSARWLRLAHISPAAVFNKQRAIRRRAHLLQTMAMGCMTRLWLQHRNEEDEKRLQLLQRGLPVPPAAMIDQVLRRQVAAPSCP